MTSECPILRILPFAMAAALHLPAAAEEAQHDTDPNRPAATGAPTSVVVEATPPYIPSTNTIATRLALPLRLTPAHVGTVNEPLLRDQHALVLGDALRNVSGVNVQTITNLADYFSIRGFDSLTSSLVLTDGAPEPEATFYQMYNVDRVEVLKGPGGFLYGRNPLTGALAGVVNIVRRQPVAGTFGRAGVSAGSFGTYDGTVDFNTSGSDGGLLFRLNSTWRESDFYRDDKENRNLAVNPALTWRIGARTSLNLNLEYVEADYRPDSGLPLFNNEIPDVPRERSYQSPFDTSEQEIGRAQIDLETKLSDRWTLRNKTYGRGLDWVSAGTLFNGVTPSQTPPFQPEVSRTLTLLDDRQRFVGNQFEAVLTAATGALEHRLLAGLEVARYSDDFVIDAGQLPNIDLEDPDETASKAPPTMRFLAGDSRSLVIAPYLIDQIKLSGRLHALAGLRFDRLDFADDETGASFEQSEVSPIFGVVFSPNGRLSLYANGGRSFGPPPSRVTGDPDPEEGAQVEIGAKLDALGGRLQTTVAAYHLRRDNIGIPDDTGVTQEEGDQRSRGVEVEFAAELLPRLHAFLSYAYNEAELTRFTERVIVGFDPVTFQPIFGTADRSGNVPAFAPDHIVNLWVSKRFENGLGLAGGGRYLDDQFIAEDNSFAIDGYVTLDAAVFYAAGPWDLSLNFKNLTNREYETRGFGSTSVIPAAPFVVFGGLHYRF